MFVRKEKDDPNFFRLMIKINPKTLTIHILGSQNYSLERLDVWSELFLKSLWLFQFKKKKKKVCGCCIFRSKVSNQSSRRAIIVILPFSLMCSRVNGVPEI